MEYQFILFVGTDILYKKNFILELRIIRMYDDSQYITDKNHLLLTADVLVF
jgi:hypothetical protein